MSTQAKRTIVWPTSGTSTAADNFYPNLVGEISEFANNVPYTVRYRVQGVDVSEYDNIRIKKVPNEFLSQTGRKSLPALPGDLFWSGFLGKLAVYEEHGKMHMVCDLVERLEELVALDSRWPEFITAQANYLRGTGETLRIVAGLAAKKAARE